MRASYPTPSLFKRVAPASLTLISCSLFLSCGNFNASGVTQMAKKSVDSVANLMPRRVPIAVVRPQDLRKIPSGADRALAWDRHLDSRRFVLFAPKHYKAPKLPDTRTMPTDGGILPPLHPGRGTSLEGRGELPAN